MSFLVATGMGWYASSKPIALSPTAMKLSPCSARLLQPTARISTAPTR